MFFLYTRALTVHVCSKIVLHTCVCIFYHIFFTIPSFLPYVLQSADENLNFEEQILEAAKNIAGATSALVKSATAAQRELVAQGKLSSNPQSEDGQWSEGLVSAVSHILGKVYA